MIRKIYLASPFFNDRETGCLERAEQILRKRGYEVFSPREHNLPDEIAGTASWSRRTFQVDREGIEGADCIVLLYWGNYSDSGTAWECGYAYAIGKPVLVVQLGESSNLMVHEGSHTNLNGVEELEAYDFETMPVLKYTGKMY